MALCVTDTLTADHLRTLQKAVDVCCFLQLARTKLPSVGKNHGTTPINLTDIQMQVTNVLRQRVSPPALNIKSEFSGTMTLNLDYAILWGVTVFNVYYLH